MASEAHKFASVNQVTSALGNNLEDGKYSGWGAYGLSKAANVLFTEELQHRIDAAGLRGSAVALHPGAVQTDLGRYIVGGADAGDVRPSESTSTPTGFGKLLQGALNAVILPIDRGANTQVYLAAAADTGGNYAAKTALYFDAMKPAIANQAATDPELARKLWGVSEALTGKKLL